MSPQATLSAADPTLARIIKSLSLADYVCTHNVFHDLLSCIIEQQIHYRSTKKTFEKLLLKAQLGQLTVSNFLVFEKVALIHAKISNQKMETIAAILLFWEENNISWQSCSDTEVKNQLSSIKGIGAWTIDMILLYTLQRPVVFPADDFHLKHIMTELYGLNPASKLKAQMHDIAKTWGEHTSLAVRYLLEWKKLKSELL